MQVKNNMSTTFTAAQPNLDEIDALVFEHEKALDAARTELLTVVRTSDQAQKQFFSVGGILMAVVIGATAWMVISMPSGLDEHAYWMHVLGYVAVCVVCAFVCLKCYFVSQRAAERLTNAYFRYGELNRSGRHLTD